MRVITSALPVYARCLYNDSIEVISRILSVFFKFYFERLFQNGQDADIMCCTKLQKQLYENTKSVEGKRISFHRFPLNRPELTGIGFMD